MATSTSNTHQPKNNDNAMINVSLINVQNAHKQMF